MTKGTASDASSAIRQFACSADVRETAPISTTCELLAATSASRNALDLPARDNSPASLPQ
jgi:hypothetical protein